jgi:prolyl 4-hydroxylase
MPSIPKVSSIVSWIFYLVPIYIFIIAPAWRSFFPTEDTENLLGGGDYDDGQALPELNTTDDSFISPEDGVPLTCPGDDYRVHIFSRAPLLIYIENFLSDQEADHLVAVRYVRIFSCALLTLSGRSRSLDA